jgi:DNA helicase TIP49 (TBP-interacting protein)
MVQLDLVRPAQGTQSLARDGRGEAVAAENVEVAVHRSTDVPQGPASREKERGNCEGWLRHH